jgi:hypothetical protein
VIVLTNTDGSTTGEDNVACTREAATPFLEMSVDLFLRVGKVEGTLPDRARGEDKDSVGNGFAGGKSYDATLSVAALDADNSADFNGTDTSLEDAI